MKRFKSRKKKYNRYILLIILIIILFFISRNIINKRIDIIKYINTPYKLSDIDSEKILLHIGLNYLKKEANKEANKEVNNVLPVISEYKYKPKIYLYNTHFRESYVSYDVHQATLYLKEVLKDNIDVTYEELDVVKELENRNLAYNNSYLITRELLEKNLNTEYQIYIDIHRDSASHDITTVEIDNKKYAKVMFVIGAKHENYQENYSIADHLNKEFKNINPDLSRGILVRKTAIYNQDLSNNVILIEVGGVENTKEEVNNSIDLLANIIVSYLNE